MALIFGAAAFATKCCCVSWIWISKAGSGGVIHFQPPSALLTVRLASLSIKSSCPRCLHEKVGCLSFMDVPEGDFLC